MKKWSEMSFGSQLVVMLLTAGIIVGGGEYAWLNTIRTSNQDMESKVKTLEAENEKVRPNEARLKQLKVENEQLEQQLANLRNIVPEEKEPDVFIRLVQEAAVQAGINVRRFSARAAVQKDFVTQAPFDLSLDGNYYTVLQFFDRLARLSRIINVDNLSMRPASAGSGGRYTLSPNETVVATCTATTFFSRDQQLGPRR